MPIRDDQVLPLNRRPDEVVTEGRNKVRFIIGTDRKNTVDSGFGSGGQNDKKSGALIVTIGGDERDLNLTEDDVVLFLSEKTNPDEYFSVDMGTEKKEEAAAILSSQNIYLISKGVIKLFRNNFVLEINENEIKIQRKDGPTITLNSNGIVMGQGSEEFSPLGNKLKTWLETSTVQTAMGPAKFNPTDIQRFVADVLSTKVKIG